MFSLGFTRPVSGGGGGGSSLLAWIAREAAPGDPGVADAAAAEGRVFVDLGGVSGDYSIIVTEWGGTPSGTPVAVTNSGWVSPVQAYAIADVHLYRNGALYARQTVVLDGSVAAANFRVIAGESGVDIVGATATGTVVDFEITTPAVYAGTYSVDLNDLNGGPVALMAVARTGTTGTGNDYIARPGLYAHRINTIPAFTYRWTRDGVDISGETGATYTQVAGDSGTDIQLFESVEDTYGVASTHSVFGVAINDAHAAAMNAPGSFYWDFARSNLSDGGAATGDGDDIGHVPNIAGSSDLDLLAPPSERPPRSGDYAAFSAHRMTARSGTWLAVPFPAARMITAVVDIPSDWTGYLFGEYNSTDTNLSVAMIRDHFSADVALCSMLRNLSGNSVVNNEPVSDPLAAGKYIWTIKFDQAGGSLRPLAITQYINGAETASYDSGSNAGFNSFNEHRWVRDTLAVGGRLAASPTNAKIAAIVGFQATGETLRATVESALAAQYGITLT